MDTLLVPLTDADVPVDLGPLASRIRRSSNFRFAWQWFALEKHVAATPEWARGILAGVVSDRACHSFLRATFDDMYESCFSIAPLHEHADFVEARDALETTLARAAADRLGAYSRHVADASPAAVARVKRAFGPLGPYVAFQLEADHVPGCAACDQHAGHLFTNWFFGVAWDWCFCVIAESRQLAWVGCLTDTD